MNKFITILHIIIGTILFYISILLVAFIIDSEFLASIGLLIAPAAMIYFNKKFTVNRTKYYLSLLGSIVVIFAIGKALTISDTEAVGSNNNIVSKDNEIVTDDYIINLIYKEHNSKYSYPIGVDDVKINSKELQDKKLTINTNVIVVGIDDYDGKVVDKVKIELFKQGNDWILLSYDILGKSYIADTPVSEDTILSDFKFNFDDKVNDVINGTRIPTGVYEYGLSKLEKPQFRIYDNLHISEIISDTGIFDYSYQNIELNLTQNTPIYNQIIKISVSYFFNGSWKLEDIKVISYYSNLNDELTDEFIKNKFINYFENYEMDEYPEKINKDSINIISKTIKKGISDHVAFDYVYVVEIKYTYDNEERYIECVLTPFKDGESLGFIGNLPENSYE